jgi:hypothetical protein
MKQEGKEKRTISDVTSSRTVDLGSCILCSSTPNSDNRVKKYVQMLETPTGVRTKAERVNHRDFLFYSI